MRPLATCSGRRAHQPLEAAAGEIGGREWKVTYLPLALIFATLLPLFADPPACPADQRGDPGRRVVQEDVGQAVVVVRDDAGRVRPERDVPPVVAGHGTVPTVAVRLGLVRGADSDLRDRAAGLHQGLYRSGHRADGDDGVATPTQAALRIFFRTVPPGLGRATSGAGGCGTNAHSLDLSAWRSRMGARIHDFGERMPGFPGCDGWPYQGPTPVNTVWRRRHPVEQDAPADLLESYRVHADPCPLGHHLLERDRAHPIGIVLIQLQQDPSPTHLLRRMRPRTNQTSQLTPFSRAQRHRPRLRSRHSSTRSRRDEGEGTRRNRHTPQTTSIGGDTPTRFSSLDGPLAAEWGTFRPQGWHRAPLTIAQQEDLLPRLPRIAQMQQCLSCGSDGPHRPVSNPGHPPRS